MNTVEAITDSLKNHLPFGSYDSATATVVHDDITAHATALAKAFDDAQGLLSNISSIPESLLTEYERDLGLPLLCGESTVGDDVASRLAEIARVQKEGHVLLNLDGFLSLFARYNQTVDRIVTRQPMQCDGGCTDPLNTPRTRFKVTVYLNTPISVSIDCLKANYFPASLWLDLQEV